jgi:hypothetical protein
VHLTGESDAGDFFGGQIRARDGFADGEAGGTPPVFGMLFGPADLRRSEGLMVFCRRRNDTPMAIEDKGARASGADVYS